MKTALTIASMPVITLIVALTVQEFFLGITLSVLFSYLSYMFWDMFFRHNKKDWMLRAISKQSGHNLMNKEIYIDYALKHRR